MPKGIPGSRKKKKPGKRGRPKKFAGDSFCRFRMSDAMYKILQEIAFMENTYSTREVTIAELIRDAVSFVYLDNERMRECFRRTRHNSTRRLVPRMP